MSARSADADSRENSPDHEGSPGRRTSKKRKVLSCYACRNRKMKCDRIYPVCGRCRKTGRSDQCTYDPRLLEDVTGSNGNLGSSTIYSNAPNFSVPNSNVQDDAIASASLDALRTRARAQERRIQELEHSLQTQGNYSNPSQRRHFQPKEPEFAEEMMFRAKGFKTAFHGSSSVMSTIWQFRELQAFTREALTLDHSIMRVKTDFKTLRDRRKAQTKEMEPKHGTDEQVFALVPDRHTVDVEVIRYFESWETTYRILHQPSFMREYQVFWEQQQDGHTRAVFAVLLILMIAINKCLTLKDDIFAGDTTVDRQEASSLINICSAWISRQPRKRLTLQFFQLHCLLLLAKRINCVGLKQDWIAAGDLVRLAIASGMHRDPPLLANVSPFEKEMKKRLWFTIAELELQSSIESGLQSSLTSLYWDTSTPANLFDEAFSAETSIMPADKPPEHFTTATYLRIAAQSLPLRIHLTQLVNDPSEVLRLSDTLDYDAQIHELLSELPSWEDARALLPLALLRLQLGQFLLILHKPYAKIASTNERFMYSFTQCVEAGCSMTATHEELLSKGILALNHLRNDVLRVGMMLSQVVYQNCARHGPFKHSALSMKGTETHFADPQAHLANPKVTKRWTSDLPLYLAVIPREPFLARTLCISAIEVLELTGQLFEQKVMRMGTAYMEYWLLTAAIGMLPSSPSTKLATTSIAYVTNATDDIHSRCRKTLDRFQSLASRVLMLQNDQGTSFACSLRETMASVSPSKATTPHTDPNGRTTETGNEGQIPAVPLNYTELGHQTQGEAAFSSTLGIGGETNAKDMNGTFDMMQDLPYDFGNWDFPDCWAFDLGGDF